MLICRNADILQCRCTVMQMYRGVNILRRRCAAAGEKTAAGFWARGVWEKRWENPSVQETVERPVPILASDLFSLRRTGIPPEPFAQQGKKLPITQKRTLIRHTSE